MKRNERGVTLIALVVTIVVLLILAGTAIAMLSGDDGIMTNAQRAQAANTEGEIREKFQMAFNAVKTDVDVNSALDSAYDATQYDDANKDTSTIVKLFETAVDEIGLTRNNLTAEDDGIKMILDTSTNTIFMQYSDNKFGGSGAATTSNTADTFNNETAFNALPNGTSKINEKNLKPIRALIQLTPSSAKLLIDPEQVV